MRLLLFIVLLAVVAVALVMVARSSGPRITRIEHRREDDEKDRDDA
jgi:hypothetical protein